LIGLYISYNWYYLSEIYLLYVLSNWYYLSEIYLLYVLSNWYYLSEIHLLYVLSLTPDYSNMQNIIKTFFSIEES